MQTNHLFIYRDLSSFTTKCIKGQIKALFFVFVLLVIQKVQYVESVNIQVAKERAKREYPVCLRAVEKYKGVESVNTQNN